MGRVIKENPFMFTTLDKPYEIYGREDQIINIIRCLEGIMEQKSFNIFIVGADKSGKTSFLKLIKLLGGEEDLDAINFYEKTLDSKYMEFNFSSYYFDCSRVKSVEDLIIKLNINNRYKFTDIKAKLTSKFAEVQGKIDKVELPLENKLKDKIRILINKGKKPLVLLFDNVYDLLIKEEAADLIKTAVSELQFENKMKVSFVFSCSNLEYEQLQNRFDDEVVKINIYNREGIKKGIKRILIKENINLNDQYIDFVINKFNCDVRVIMNFFKEIEKENRFNKIDLGIYDIYNNYVINNSSNYKVIVEGLDYNYKKIIKYLLNNVYLEFEECKTLLNTHDESKIKTIVYNLEDKGIISVLKGLKLEIRSEFVKECLSR